MDERAYLISYIGFSGPNSENGAVIVASTPQAIEQDALTIARQRLMLEYQEQAAVTSIVPLMKDALVKDISGEHYSLINLLLGARNG